MQPFPHYKIISWVSLSGLLYFVLAVLSLHFLDPEMNPEKNFISEYAGGNYRWLSQSAFWVLSLSFTLVTLGMILRMSESMAAWLPILLFCIAVVGLVVLTAHPIYRDHGSFARAEMLQHNDAAWTGFSCIIAGQFLWPLVLFFQADWRKIALFLFLLGTSTLAYFILQGIEDFSHRDTALLGLHQRVLVGLICSWMGICALKLGTFGSAEIPAETEDLRQ